MAVCKRNLYCLIILQACIWLPQNICSAADTLSIPVTVKATIVIPPCTLNGGYALDVDFNDVQIRDVNLNQRPEKRTVVKKVQITCPAAVTNTNDLKVTMSGLQAAAGSNILSTNGGRGAGIALYQGESSDTTFPLNQPIPLAGLGNVSGDATSGYSGQLSFTARVVKAGAADVTDGEFSAVATLLLKQQ
ncbi:type 1 fimbrial protein [Citrobacter amalonaticus]|nr:type 1 fimbrial protein [Citrobacter amalonaticus]